MPHKTKRRCECNPRKRMQLVYHAGNFFLKIALSNHNNRCKATGILLGEERGFRPAEMAFGKLFTMRRWPNSRRATCSSSLLWVCVPIDLQEANYPFHRELV